MARGLQQIKMIEASTTEELETKINNFLNSKCGHNRFEVTDIQYRTELTLQKYTKHYAMILYYEVVD